MSVTLFSSIGGDLRLLRPFLEHYRKLGVDRIFLCLHQRNEDAKTVEEVRSVAEASGALLDAVWIDPRLNHAKRYEERRGMVARRCSTSDWVIVADLDEFQYYRTGLDAAVAYCERRGYQYVTGKLVDRIAADGSFPVLDVDNIWRQFPVESELTRNILKGAHTKVGVSRAAIEVGPGHHHVIGPGVLACPAEELFVEVHHFKWDRDVLSRLRGRMEMIKREGWDWWQESDAFLRYVDLNGGQLDLGDERLAVRLSERLGG